MSITGISASSNISSVESLLNTVLQGTGSATASSAGTSDNAQLSPFAKLVSTLQALQQTNPSEYQQLTQQIATNLNAAAQSAQASGNTNLANQLSQLGTDFQNASTTGQLPNLQDLASATSSHHHHAHAGAAHSCSGASDTSDANAASASNGSSSNALQQLLASFQTATQNQSQSLNPLSIIANTLSSARITISNS